MSLRTNDRCGKYRIQESEVRSENEEHLIPAFCFLRSADGLANFEGGGVERALRRHERSGQDVTADRGRKKPVTSKSERTMQEFL
jgi:hypothetical protein